jgi:hypothetical protein
MTVEPRIGVTFEDVWATIRELAEQHKETERAVKELAEQHKETERFLKESKAETERFLKESKRELNQAMGKLSNRFGELVEHLVSPNLLEKFNALGYAFTKTNTRVKYKNTNTGETLAEVDALLENGGCALAVEIKTHPSVEDVDGHIKRMETLREYADAHNDKRSYLGAIAGGVMSESVKSRALKKGFYALEQPGDTMSIAAAPEAWKPRKW